MSHEKEKLVHELTQITPETIKHMVNNGMHKTIYEIIEKCRNTISKDLWGN